MNDRNPAQAQSEASAARTMRLCRADIAARTAHCDMLSACGLIPEDAHSALSAVLNDILTEAQAGILPLPAPEKLIFFLDKETERRAGKKAEMLYTALSQNDLYATELRMYLRGSTDLAIELYKRAIENLLIHAKEGVRYVMPWYSRSRKTKTVNCAQYFNAFGEMFLRDMDRILQCRERIDVMPLGSGSLAGVPYSIDRSKTKAALRFAAVTDNAPDAVTDRDFAAEYLFDIALATKHLTHLYEDALLFCSGEFALWRLPEDLLALAADVCEHANTPCSRLSDMLSSVGPEPLSAEDGHSLFAAEAVFFEALEALSPILKALKLEANMMFMAAGRGCAAAEDVEEYLKKRGMGVPEAQAVVSKLSRICNTRSKSFAELSLEDYRAVSDVFERDILAAVTTRSRIESRISEGGSSTVAARKGVLAIKRKLRKY